MFVSPRFRDIFSSRPIQTRSGDKVDSHEELDRDGKDGSLDAEAIWLDITAAHRRAAMAFTPERLRLAELATDEA